jgi:hypothetical protein
MSWEPVTDPHEIKRLEAGIMATIAATRDRINWKHRDCYFTPPSINARCIVSIRYGKIAGYLVPWEKPPAVPRVNAEWVKAGRPRSADHQMNTKLKWNTRPLAELNKEALARRSND